MRFAGYSAVFDRVDRGGDVVRRSAFAGQLDRPVSLSWQHDSAQQIGTISYLREDAKGLRVIGPSAKGLSLTPGGACRLATASSHHANDCTGSCSTSISLK